MADAGHIFETEKQLLKACALRLDGDRFLHDRWDQKKRNVAANKIHFGCPFEDTVDNLALFYLASQSQIVMSLVGGSQISPDWIFFRKLFLICCDIEVPQEYENADYVKAWKRDYLPDLTFFRRFVQMRCSFSESFSVTKFEQWVIDERELPAILAGSAYGDIARKFRNLSFMREPEETPSLQVSLLNFYRESNFPEIDDQFRRAKLSAKSQLFRHAVELTLGEEISVADEINIEDAKLRTKILANPILAKGDESCIDYLFDGMGYQGASFLYELANNLKKTDDRKRRVKTDLHMLVLARHWVDPHCPLWLMSKGAMHIAGRTLSTGGEWSDSRVEERLRKKVLFQCERQPIRDVIFKRSENDENAPGEFEISGFRVLRSIHAQARWDSGCGYSIEPR